MYCSRVTMQLWPTCVKPHPKIELLEPWKWYTSPFSITYLPIGIKL